jgi:nucleoside-diphosphate-sugar epimerase
MKSLGWEAKIRLEEGIKIAYIWYFNSLEERRDRYV